MLSVEPHPLLEAAAFTTQFPSDLERCAVSAEIAGLLAPGAAAPLASDDAVRKAVRDLLRRSGYKPTGRGKPASEYLAQNAAQGPLPRINLAVDACNAVSLHSGLPISVVDLDLTRPPLRIAVAGPGATYVFNPAGQQIALEGLLCLCDADGPCANAVKDAQRTKTRAQTRRTLTVIWGTRELPRRAATAARWYRGLLEAAGASTADVELASG